ncbi:MAG TPA: zinc ribbon domain-containing protein [Myxococcota bacterium]|nr:zinc ribbon domain-containing protein [Myxococcota bacterium]
MPVCPHCGLENSPSETTCASCGKPLGPLEVDTLLEAGIVCPACDTYNETSAKKCIRCGQALSGLTGFLDAVSTPAVEQRSEKTVVEAKPEGLPAPRTGHDTVPVSAAAPPSVAAPGKQAPRAKKATGRMPAAVAMPGNSASCPFCQARLPTGAVFCLACGRKLSQSRPELAQTADMSVRLRLVRGYGREDSTYPVGPQGISIGRGKALINIAEDPFLSPLHMTLRIEAGRLIVVDDSSLNGTFLRVRGQSDLHQGTELIAGSQRIILLGLGGPTTDVRTPRSTDTSHYGGPPSHQLFIALRVVYATRKKGLLAGPVILRSGPNVTIGQRDCDVNFPGDSRMAPRHLELHLRSAGLEVSATGASGVFVRIRDAVSLQNGDEIMAGEEVFRIEMG